MRERDQKGRAGIAKRGTASQSLSWKRSPASTRPSLTRSSTPSSAGGVTVGLGLPDDVAAVPAEAVRGAVDDLAVDTLDGLAIPQPSPKLAHQLQDLVVH